MFVVLEGIDASGKDTQGHLLAERFEKNGVKAREFSFPNRDSIVGEVIYRHLKGETYLCSNFHGASGIHCDDSLMFECMMIANRYEQALEIIKSINARHPVIAKRWWPSAYVYGGNNGLPHAWLREAHEYLPKPDLYILLDIDIETSIQRRPERRDKYEENIGFLQKNIVGYRELWKNENPVIWHVIDGRLPSVDVHALIWRAVYMSMDNQF